MKSYSKTLTRDKPGGVVISGSPFIARWELQPVEYLFDGDYA